MGETEVEVVGKAEALSGVARGGGGGGVLWVLEPSTSVNFRRGSKLVVCGIRK